MSDKTQIHLAYPLSKAVEESIKKQIDKGARDSEGTSDPKSQVSGNENNVPEREPTVTKMSSAEFYLDVRDSVNRILEKRAACGTDHGKRKTKIPPQFLSKR